MKLNWTQLKYWEQANHPEAWLTLVSGGMTVIFTLLSAMVAAYLTYRYTVKHSKTTHNTQIKIDRLRRDIEALEKVWELLTYMSFSESDKAIIKWREERDPTNNKKVKHYFYQFENLKQFLLKDIQNVFYTQHAGLFLPNSIRDQIFKYKSLLMGLYLRHENGQMTADDSSIPIENPELIKKLLTAYEVLNKEIKKELEWYYKQLLIDGK